MQSVSSNAALVVWNKEKLDAWRTDNLWPELKAKLEEQQAILDQASAVILSGPIRCELGVLWSGELMNTNVGAFKQLSFGFSSRTLLELHTGNRDAAWTNLMTLTRLVTAWQIEPVEHSHMVRMALLPTVLATTWQAMQTNFWADPQLAALQQEWASLDLFSELPETAALAGANAVMMCRLDREQETDTTSSKQIASDLLRSPRIAWRDLVSNYRESVYRNSGSYKDENALMLYFHGRELQIKHAITAKSWSEMRSLPGVTNIVPPPPGPESRRLGALIPGQPASDNPNLNRLLLGRAASAEGIRRLLVTGLALGRYRIRYGVYPQSLNDLVPELLTNQASDFMDGKPLHYQLTSDGHFVLYSIGLDCIDQGGDMQPVKYWHEDQGTRSYALGPEADLVWPRPASSAEESQSAN